MDMLISNLYMVNGNEIRVILRIEAREVKTFLKVGFDSFAIDSNFSDKLKLVGGLREKVVVGRGGITILYFV